MGTLSRWKHRFEPRWDCQNVPFRLRAIEPPITSAASSIRARSKTESVPSGSVVP
jgi:hypothetical protein